MKSAEAEQEQKLTHFSITREEMSSMHTQFEQHKSKFSQQTNINSIRAEMIRHLTGRHFKKTAGSKEKQGFKFIGMLAALHFVL